MRADTGDLTTELSGRCRLVNAATVAHGPLEHVVRRHFTPLYAFRNAVSRCTAKDPKPIERVGGKLQGEVTRGELPGECGGLSRIERAELGGALRFCFRGPRRHRGCRQRKGR